GEDSAIKPDRSSNQAIDQGDADGVAAMPLPGDPRRDHHALVAELLPTIADLSDTQTGRRPTTCSSPSSALLRSRVVDPSRGRNRFVFRPAPVGVAVTVHSVLGYRTPAEYAAACTWSVPGECDRPDLESCWPW